MTRNPNRSAMHGAANNWLLGLVCSVQLILVVDTTIVVVALPTIGHDLSIPQGDLQWIITIYALTFGGFLMIGGRAADVFGQREMFASGLLIFLVASVTCALAKSEPMLLAARAIEGLGAAAVSPATLSVLVTNFPEGRARNRALGAWSATSAAGGIGGNVVGGILTSTIGWRWIFLLNVPICIMAIGGARRLISRASLKQREPLDLAGALVVTLGLGTLIFGFSQAERYGFGSSSSLIALGVAATLLAMFIPIERQSARPLLPPPLFRGRLAVGTSLILLSGPLFGWAYVFLSLYLQDVRAYSPISAGVAFVPWGLVWASSATIVSRHVTVGRLQVLAPIGFALVGAGLVLLMRIGLESTYLGVLVPAFVVLGIGGGIVSVCNTIVATSGVPPDRKGVAAGVINSAQQVGSAVGIALLVTVSVARQHRLMANGASRESAIVTGDRLGLLVALGFAVVSLVTSLWMLLLVKEFNATVVSPGGSDLGHPPRS